MTQWNLNKIEESFVAAAIDPTRWSDALHCISTETGGCGAILLPVTANPIPNVPVTEELARAAEIYFRDGWHLRDVRYNVSIPKFVRTGLIDDFDCVPSEEIERHPYYQEFLAPAGLRWFAGVSMQAGDDIWCVSINRKIDQDPFSPDEKRKLAQISRAVSTAAVFAQALGFAAANATLEAFDVSGTAVVLLDRQAEVIRTNRAADNLLRDGSARVIGRRLVAQDPSATAALGRALHSLLWSSAGSSLMPAVPLPRESKAPILAYPLKLPTLSANPLGTAQAVVVLVDPSAKRRTPEVNLQRAFQLTAAEARLASHLAAGDPLDAVCDQIGISKETGRNQLKSVFAKTGINRQVELVLLLSRML
ncbi:helix-turn-helix transcriptional regulator [Bradyrhizobium sp. STM 3562]|uniref:helix-turn-helix transcriptional regulator n=1 Tax=Bradyrhizobium sp. STM 3562 TaxID=578924 RepID=UPI00388D4CC6